MRKSFLWVAVALSGFAFARSASADAGQGDRGTSMGAQATPANRPNGTNVTGAREPCPPRRQLTAEQRRLRAEAAQRAREAREAAEQARLAELQGARDAEAQARADAARQRDAAAQAANDAAQARAREEAAQRALQQERSRAAMLSSVLAERERIDARRRQHRDIVARGGGPLHYRPLFTFGFDGGVAGFANAEMRNSVYAGGSWGGRIGVDFADWIGIEGRYFGMANPLYAPSAGTGTLLTNGGTGVLRLTIPTRWVQPYGFVGVGAYHTQTWRPVEGSNTVVASQNNIALPAGLGLNFPIGRVVSIAAEGTYHALWNFDGTTTSADQPNGIWNGSAVLRFRL